MKYTAVIPARGGSKGIVDKNMVDINGEPMIAWSIRQALSCNEVDQVYVSTDSPKIQEIAIKYGAKAPFLRPKSISGDTATTESAVMHFIQWSEENSLILDNVILVQATSPFRYKSSFSDAIKIFESKNADSLVSVTKTHSFFWKKSNSMEASYDIYNRPRRQDIKDELYIENGSFYITKLDVYKKHKNRLGGEIVMFEMTPEESYEIDSMTDFHIVELMMKKYGENFDNQ